MLYIILNTALGRKKKIKNYNHELFWDCHTESFFPIETIICSIKMMVSLQKEIYKWVSHVRIWDLKICYDEIKPYADVNKWNNID